MLIWRLVCLAALFAIATDAHAMRCGTRLVLPGQHQAKVLDACGEPVHVQQRLLYRSGITRSTWSSARRPGVYSGNDATRDELLVHQRSVVEVFVEEWTYNFGPRKLMRVVRFENGVVRDVKTLGYGYRE